MQVSSMVTWLAAQPGLVSPLLAGQVTREGTSALQGRILLHTAHLAATATPHLLHARSLSVTIAVQSFAMPVQTVSRKPGRPTLSSLQSVKSAGVGSCVRALYPLYLSASYAHAHQAQAAEHKRRHEITLQTPLSLICTCASSTGSCTQMQT